jgi:hypothetical protein
MKLGVFMRIKSTTTAVNIGILIYRRSRGHQTIQHVFDHLFDEGVIFSTIDSEINN